MLNTKKYNLFSLCPNCFQGQQLQQNSTTMTATTTTSTYNNDNDNIKVVRTKIEDQNRKACNIENIFAYLCLAYCN